MIPLFTQKYDRSLLYLSTGTLIKGGWVKQFLWVQSINKTNILEGIKMCRNRS